MQGFSNVSGVTLQRKQLSIADNGEVVGVDKIDGTLLKLKNELRDRVRLDVTMFTHTEIRKLLSNRLLVMVRESRFI